MELTVIGSRNCPHIDLEDYITTLLDPTFAPSSSLQKNHTHIPFDSNTAFLCQRYGVSL